MPEPVAKRYRGGETSIAAQHHDVSVVYAGVEGFDTFANSRSAEEAVELLNTLSRSFEDAAARAGVEKVRSVGTGYIASSGAVVNRVDHARRVVDFALEMGAAVERFNSQHGTQLVIRAGIDTGDVQSGLIGRQDVVYNLWGTRSTWPTGCAPPAASPASTSPTTSGSDWAPPTSTAPPATSSATAPRHRCGG